MTKLLLKVCGLKNPLNIKDVDALGVDYIGMIFYNQSARRMDKNPDAIPETKAKRVGVFVDASIETIIKKAREFKLNTVQLHGSETPEFCKEINELGYDVFKAFNVNENTIEDELTPYKKYCKHFLFDTKTEVPGGSGKKFNWKVLDKLAHVHTFFLSGGISLEDADAIKNLQYDNLVGIDVNSKFEIEPGIKDIEKLKSFIENIKSGKEVSFA